MVSLRAVEWFGTFLGIFGALLLALNTSYSGYGFIVFLLSNIVWAYFGIKNGTKGFVVLQLVLVCTNLIGIYRWLV